MDGENNGKPYFLMDDLEVPLFLETSIYLDPEKKLPQNTTKSEGSSWSTQRIIGCKVDDFVSEGVYIPMDPRIRCSECT